MKNPTTNGNDLYQVANDYCQTVSAYFVPSSYADGFYTEGKTSAVWTDVTGLNKRIFNVPQDEWSISAGPSAIFAPEYATAVFSGDPE